MTEDAWKKLVTELHLDLTKPINLIKASKIKQITGEEPRNIAYIDEREKLPAILAKHGVFPLAVRNGVYALVKGNGFHDLEQIEEPTVPFHSQLPFTLVTTRGAIGEDKFLLFALNSGLIAELTGVSQWLLTGTGRRFLRRIRFRMGNGHIIMKKGRLLKREDSIKVYQLDHGKCLIKKGRK